MTTPGAVTIKFLDENNPAVLYRHDPRQLEAHPCHLEFDPRTGQLSAGTSAAGDPVRRWRIPCLTAGAANGLMRKIAPLVKSSEQIIADAIEDYCERAEQVRGQDPYAWWGRKRRPLPDITEDTADAELAVIVAEEVRYATTHEQFRYTVLLDAGEYLAEVREGKREGLRDVLEVLAEEHRRSERRLHGLIKQLAGWGDKTQDIAGRAGMSEAAVRQAVEHTPTSPTLIRTPHRVPENGVDWTAATNAWVAAAHQAGHEEIEVGTDGEKRVVEIDERAYVLEVHDGQVRARSST